MVDTSAIDPELLKRLTGHSDLDLAMAIDAARPRVATVAPEAGEAPTLERANAAPTPIGGMGALPEVKGLPNLSVREQKRLPVLSPGVTAGTAADYENQLTRLRTPSEPATTGLGKLGHVLSRIGNIAGDIVAPGVMANIPGTDINKRLETGAVERKLADAKKAESEETERAATTGEVQARTKKIEADTEALQTANKENLVTDAQGNVTGWKGNHGELHSLEEAGTPQAIKDIAEATANKQVPKFEKTDNGNIVELKTDKTGKTTSEIVYKGDPKVETELVHGHMVAGVPHTLLVNKRTGETVKDLGAEKMPSEAAAKEHNIEVVKAFDKNNKPHLLSKEDAEKEGYSHVTKASEKAINDATTHHVTLNDMQTKLNDVVASRKALDQDAAQRVIIARALRSIDKYSTPGQLLDSGILAGATPQTQEYIQSVLSLRESALGLPKEITGGSRVSEIQASALWGTLPGGASLNGDYALNLSKKFQANIDRLRERAPEVRGISQTDPHPDLGAKTPGVVRNPDGTVDWNKTLGIEKKP